MTGVQTCALPIWNPNLRPEISKSATMCRASIWKPCSTFPDHDVHMRKEVFWEKGRVYMRVEFLGLRGGQLKCNPTCIINTFIPGGN